MVCARRATEAKAPGTTTRGEWREQQPVEVVRMNTYTRRKMLARKLLVVETRDKQCVVMQRECVDKRINVGMGLTDKEGKTRCAITGKRVEIPLSVHDGKCTPCSERMDRERILMVRSKGKSAPIEQDEPFDEEKGSCKMKQYLPHFPAT